MKILGWTFFALGGGGFIFSIIVMITALNFSAAGVAIGSILMMWISWGLAHPKPKKI